ncbi:hypothetical protein [Actinocorallia longicatena]|uniref:Mce-associated membrane protein n=1 Tax=Actinocorallia longicatena TaxID=111803 RepID=A0ABP6QKP1_9ACTN
MSTESTTLTTDDPETEAEAKTEQPETEQPEIEQPEAEQPGKETPQERGRKVTIAIPMPGKASLGRILLVLALVAAVAAATWQWRNAERLEDEQRTSDRIVSVAGRFGQALLSYDHGDLGRARDRVLALATPDFGKTYEVAFTGTLQSTITRLQADATATVRVVYVRGGENGSAQAVVVMDSQVKSSAGTRDVTGSYLQMDLVEQKGQWKVSAVNSIGAINESLTATPSAKPSPTP